jgi:hypothetical protein
VEVGRDAGGGGSAFGRVDGTVKGVDGGSTEGGGERVTRRVEAAAAQWASRSGKPSLNFNLFLTFYTHSLKLISNQTNQNHINNKRTTFSLYFKKSTSKTSAFWQLPASLSYCYGMICWPITG